MSKGGAEFFRWLLIPLADVAAIDHDVVLVGRSINADRPKGKCLEAQTRFPRSFPAIASLAHKLSAIQITKISTLIVWKQIKPKKCRPARWVKARRLPFISAPNDSMLVLAGEFLNRCKICAAARATDVVIVGNRTGQDRAKPYNSDCSQIGREHAYNPRIDGTTAPNASSGQFPGLTTPRLQFHFQGRSRNCCRSRRKRLS